jgi:DNA-binding transcriptional LysR family regulator
MLPEVLCLAELRARRLVRVLDGYEGEAGGVFLLYRAHRSLTAAVRTCIDHFLTELPGYDPGSSPPRTRA